MNHSYLAGTGYYVPETILDNAYFVARNPFNAYDKEGNIIEQVHTSHEKIMEVMGIRERRKIADGEDVYHLAARAARKALEDAKCPLDDLEGIVVATVSNRQRFPAVAVRVKQELQAKNVHFCYDLAAACAGFPYALDAADKRAKQTGKPCLAIGAEALTQTTDYTDRDCPLFGDGAGTALLVPSTNEQRGMMGFMCVTDPFDGKAEWIFQHPQGYIKMPEGRKVLRKAVRGMYDLTIELKKQLGWEHESIALYIPHQANKRIITGYTEHLGVSPEKVFDNIEWFGNMSSATCAVGLAQAREKKLIHPGDKVIVVSVGSGIEVSAVGLIM